MPQWPTVFRLRGIYKRRNVQFTSFAHAHQCCWVLPFREVSFLFCLEIPAGCYHRSKFTCPHTAMPSDTQLHLVLNIEITWTWPLLCIRRPKGRGRQKQEIRNKNNKTTGMKWNVGQRLKSKFVKAPLSCHFQNESTCLCKCVSAWRWEMSDIKVRDK